MLERCPRFLVVLSAVVGLLVIGACGGPTTLSSRSGTQAPSVDGALKEWGGSLTYVDDRSVSMGAEATDSLLYVAVAIQNRGLIRSIAKNGLIVWVDPTGGEQRTYGVQYPLGLRRQRAQGPAPDAEPEVQAESSRPVGLDQVALDELEVIRHDSTRTRIPAQFSSGLRANAALNPGSLIYEVAIPVGEGAAGGPGRQHGLRTALGAPIGVGLEIREGEEETNLLKTNPGQGIPSVTGGSGRRGRRGRDRRQRQQERKKRQTQRAELPTLNLWTRVVSSSGR